MKNAIMVCVLALGVFGCQSSSTTSYVFVGDSACRAAVSSGKVPPNVIAGLKVAATPVDATKPETPGVTAVPSVQGSQGLSGQAGENGTTIIIGVNSTTSKPVEVKTDANVQVGKESSMMKAARVGGAAVGGAVAGPAGAGVGVLVPEAASAVKGVYDDTVEAIKR